MIINVIIATAYVIAWTSLGLVLIGFLLAREKDERATPLDEYLFQSLLWPIYVPAFIAERFDGSGNVRPYLRKVFGKPGGGK